MIRTCLVGCGAISRVHTDCLLAEEGVTLCALCDIAPTAAEKLMKEKNFSVPVYTDYEKMLDEVKPDAVHLCTPHFLHKEQAVAALSRNIHVFLEKPACMNEKELEELIEAEKKSSAQITVCLQNRFLTATQRAAELLQSGELGEIVGARGFVTWNRSGKYFTESPWRGRKEFEGGGVLMNQSIHTLDRLLYLCGDADRAEGNVHSYHMLDHNDTEDTAVILLSWGEKAKGVFFATTAHSVSSPVTIEIKCEKGLLSLEDPKLFLDGKEIVSGEEGSLLPGKSVWGKGHAKLIHLFYSNLGKKNPVSLAEAARALRVIWQIYESCEA